MTLTDVLFEQILAVMGGDLRPLALIAVCAVIVFGAAAAVQLYRYFRRRPKHRDESVPEWPLHHVVRFNAAVLGEVLLQRLAGKGR